MGRHRAGSLLARAWTILELPSMMAFFLGTHQVTQSIELLRGVVHPWYCDTFGHMNVRWYAHFFDDACFHIWPLFWGSHQRMQSEFGVHTVTARATTEFRKELVAGDLILVDCLLQRIGTKSCTFEERMIHADTGDVHATYEVVEVFFDPETRAAASMPDPIKQALQATG